eukprot:NODE_4790_length_1847_cov_4.059884.p1 GENE.NODE_4790_length_1847_cov_4.059884~~NODE_4790_length_1847_cov_4.059884.p1  ORF type:complete len:484 (-),score=84.99 NODE_4790_length_1847_cov_4.059884:232-1683(-)
MCSVCGAVPCSERANGVSCYNCRITAMELQMGKLVPFGWALLQEDLAFLREWHSKVQAVLQNQILELQQRFDAAPVQSTAIPGSQEAFEMQCYAELVVEVEADEETDDETQSLKDRGSLNRRVQKSWLLDMKKLDDVLQEHLHAFSATLVENCASMQATCKASCEQVAMDQKRAWKEQAQRVHELESVVARLLNHSTQASAVAPPKGRVSLSQRDIPPPPAGRILPSQTGIAMPRQVMIDGSADAVAHLGKALPWPEADRPHTGATRADEDLWKETKALPPLRAGGAKHTKAAVPSDAAAEQVSAGVRDVQPPLLAPFPPPLPPPPEIQKGVQALVPLDGHHSPDLAKVMQLVKNQSGCVPSVRPQSASGRSSHRAASRTGGHRSKESAVARQQRLERSRITVPMAESGSIMEEYPDNEDARFSAMIVEAEMMAFIWEPFEQRRSAFKRLLIAWHPDKCDNADVYQFILRRKDWFLARDETCG